MGIGRTQYIRTSSLCFWLYVGRSVVSGPPTTNAYSVIEKLSRLHISENVVYTWLIDTLALSSNTLEHVRAAVARRAVQCTQDTTNKCFRKSAQVRELPSL